MSTFNRDRFKNELLAAGYNWSDQKIDDYIAYQKAANNLKVEQTKYNNPALYDTIRKWESSDLSLNHNNPGAHIWTQELEKKFGAVKGDPFTDRLGNTLYTAKYDTLAQGDKATNFVIDKLTAKHPTPQSFVAAYTGLNPNDKKNPLTQNQLNTYNNYLSDVQNSVILNPPTGMPVSSQPASNLWDRDFGDTSLQGQGFGANAWDAIGNFAWTFGNLSTFGALGVLDYEDKVQEYLTGVGVG